MEKEAPKKDTPRGFALKLLKPHWRSLLWGFAALFIVDVVGVSIPIIFKLTLDAIETHKEFKTIVLFSLLLMFFAFLRAFFRFWWREHLIGTAHRAVYDLRRQLFEHLLKLPFSFFGRTRTGDIMSRMTNDIQEVRGLLGIGVLIVLDASLYLVSLPAIMFFLSPKLAAITVAPFILIPILVFFCESTIHRYSNDVQERLSDLSSRAEESFSGIRVIKGFRIEDSEISRFDKCGLNYVRDRMKLAKLESVFHPALDLIIVASLCLLLYFGGSMVITGAITIGTFFAFFSYLKDLAWPMMAIGIFVNTYQKAMASIKRCLVVLDEPVASSYVDSPEASNIDMSGQNFDKIVPSVGTFALNRPLNLDLVLQHVFFTYPGASAPALEDISFRLDEGQTLGITGPVGCGKTTLLRLLMKMFPPKYGIIKIGGVDTYNIELEQLRHLYAYVPQETFLFSESIRENVLFAEDDKGDADRAKEYVFQAGLREDLDDFPDKLETMLGERGVNLSGGQKQRISLARALASERPILVLDDCTSAVDTQTEREILQKLQNSDQARTCIIVSHRMVSIQHADLILYLENGRIVERGTHDHLMKLKGRYARTWERQRLKTQIESLA